MNRLNQNEPAIFLNFAVFGFLKGLSFFSILQIQQNKVAILLPDYLKPGTSPTHNSHSHAFKHFQTTTDYYKYSYFHGKISIGMLYHHRPCHHVWSHVQ
jgi:hypothetical protein